MGARVGCILSFLGGALVGAIVAYKFAYDKAEEKADIEIEEMRRYFESKTPLNKKVEAAAEKSRQSQSKPIELINTKEVPDTHKVNYTAYSEDEPEGASTVPVVLDDPNDFGEIAYYSRVNLTFYDDLILADDSTMKTFKKDEVTRAIGDALDEFDKLGKDGKPVTEVYVRNDRTKTYYEIVKSELDYAIAAGMEEDEY